MIRRDAVRTVVVGILMGAAEVVPGVSGGTIAFVAGIYERLLQSLQQFTPALLLELRRQGIVAVWQQVDATFLLVLFAAMGGAAVMLASGISYLLSDHPVLIWSFFFGLVLSSSWVIHRQIDVLGKRCMLLVIVGVLVGVTVTGLAPISLPPTPLFLFVGGAVAVCAWILPGVSGSFILLILGLYAYVIEAVKNLEITTLLLVGSGCALGLVSFAQVLSRLFKHRRDETLAVLTGFMLGSLIKLWPWKQTLEYQLRSDGGQIPLVQEPILPSTYTLLTGADAQVEFAILAALAGGAAILILDWLAFMQIGSINKE